MNETEIFTNALMNAIAGEGKRILEEAIKEATLAERQRCAQIASHFFVNNPYALHPNVPFDELNGTTQTAAHATAQLIAIAITGEEV
jgi:hypothetical protein